MQVLCHPMSLSYLKKKIHICEFWDPEVKTKGVMGGDGRSSNSQYARVSKFANKILEKHKKFVIMEVSTYIGWARLQWRWEE